MPDPLSVVSQFNRHWERGDLDAAMALVADDCVFTLHVSEDLVDHAGQWVGSEQIRMALTTARQHYDYILYRPVVMGTADNTVRVRVEFIGRHRASGEPISMTFRQVNLIENGRIARCDEYHDRSKLEAYLKLIQMYAPPPAH
ncbi:MAG: nuclear transport factor 2 family protein [Hyphomicrobiaceae bacterium]|jgi:ketosteroid isomerase-like protein